MLGRMSFASSWFCSICSGLLNISVRTVNLSCLIVLISENSYYMVVQFIRFFSTVTNNPSKRFPFIGWSNLRSSWRVSICRW